MKKLKPILIVVAAMLASTPMLRAEVLYDFEPTSGYLPGESVDSGTITDLLPGGGTVIDGLQSLSLAGVFDPSIAGTPLYAETDFSLDVDASSYLNFYIGGGVDDTAMGIQLNGSTDTISIFGLDAGAGGSHATGFSYTPGDIYTLTIDETLATGNFTAYATDDTTGAAPVDLGTYGSYDGAYGGQGTIAGYETVEGAYIQAYGGSNVIDNLTVTNAAATTTPEPTTAGLMLAGLLGLVMLVRRQKSLGL
jgi:hypothetical protein